MPPKRVGTGFTPVRGAPIAPVFAGSERTGFTPVPTRFFLFEQYWGKEPSLRCYCVPQL
jgi:hypothetical protein